MLSILIKTYALFHWNGDFDNSFHEALMAHFHVLFFNSKDASLCSTKSINSYSTKNIILRFFYRILESKITSFLFETITFFSKSI